MIEKIIVTKIVKKTMYKKKCQRCGKEMILHKCISTKRRYCSKKCMLEDDRGYLDRNNEIIKKFQAGAKKTEIAREYKLSPPTISSIIRKYDMRKARKRKLKRLEIK